MNELAIGQKNAVVISVDTKELIKVDVSENTFASCRVGGIAGASWGVGGGYTNGGQMEFCGHAGALRQGGTGGTTSDRKVQRWKVV